MKSSWPSRRARRWCSMMTTLFWAGGGLPVMDKTTSVHSEGGALQDKLEHVKALMAGYGRVIVAFSGGVDSTLVAKLARDVLGRANAPAATADSPSLARADLKEARGLAERLDLEHLVVATHEVEDPQYRANTESRCYVCKRTLFEELET